MGDAARTIQQLRDEVAALRRALDRLREVEARERRALDTAVARELTLVNALNSIVLRWDPEGRVRFLNAWGEEFFGWTTAELAGRSVVGTIVPETDSAGRDLAAMIADLLRHPERYASNENENVRRSGERVWVTWRNCPIVDDAGTLVEILTTGIDTSARKQAEEALGESERRFRVLFQSTPVALLDLDAAALRGHLDALVAGGVDDIAAHLRAHPDEIGRSLAMLVPRDRNAAALALFEAGDPAQLDAHLARVVPEGLVGPAREVLPALASGRIGSWSWEQTVVTVPGRRREAVVQATVVAGPTDDHSSILVALVDLTDRHRAEAALRESEARFRELAVRDDLTGLYNTRYLYQTLAEQLVAHARDGRPLAVVFLDLDRFKDVVDTHGHLNGSRVIQEVAGRIRAAIEPPAFAVAYAGDEFVVVLPATAKSAATVIAERLRERIAADAYLGGSVRATASFGVAAFPDDAADLESLLTVADRSLFGAKAGGRDRVRAAG